MLHATTISFYNLTPQEQITTQYASQGVTFQTEVPSGPPAISNGYTACTPDDSVCGFALTNTPTGAYPTAEDLDILFPNGASGVSFTFTNWGDNGTTYYTASSGATVVDTGALYNDPYADYFGTVTLTGSDITEIQISNGTGGESNWEFGVGELNYSTSIPEPGTLTLVSCGLLGLCGLLRRRRNT
jgi:hypothetical protein